jgi:hypothetical protein
LDNVQISHRVIHWNVPFFRAIQDWEVEVVLVFFGMLYSLRWRQGGEDCIRWIPSKRKKFEVRSFFHELSLSGVSSFPCRSIWKVKVPLRVSFFVWMAALGKILSVDNLQKRGVLVVGWCCMCKRSGEYIDHLLLHCEVARDLWSALFTLFDVTWVMPATVLDLLACWRGQVGTHSSSSCVENSPVVLNVDHLERRNARCFGVHFPIYLRIICLFSLFQWEWLIGLRNFREIFYGVVLGMSLNFI